MLDWARLEKVEESLKSRARLWLEKELGVMTTEDLRLILVDDTRLFSTIRHYANISIVLPGDKVLERLSIHPSGVFSLVVKYTRTTIAIHGVLWGDDKTPYIREIRVY